MLTYRDANKFVLNDIDLYLVCYRFVTPRNTIKKPLRIDDLTVFKKKKKLYCVYTIIYNRTHPKAL